MQKDNPTKLYKIPFTWNESKKEQRKFWKMKDCFFWREHWTTQKYIRKQPKFDMNLYWKIRQVCWIKICRSSSLQVFVKTAVLEICSKFTGEHPCRSVISIKLVRNFTEITVPYVLLCICCIFAEHSFWRTPIEDCLWICNVIKLVKMILKTLW